MNALSLVVSVSTLLAGAALLPVHAETTDANDGLELLEQSVLKGGDAVDQPSGSPIVTCCTDVGCVICESEVSGGCHSDPSYRGNSGGATPPQFHARNNDLQSVLRQ